MKANPIATRGCEREKPLGIGDMLSMLAVLSLAPIMLVSQAVLVRMRSGHDDRR